MINSDDWEAHWENFSSATDYEPARQWRRKLIVVFLNLNGNERILDIGAGKGDLIAYLKTISNKFSFGATEFSSTGLEMIKSVNQGVICGQVNLEEPISPLLTEQLLSGDGWDVVVCSEVLEHLDNPTEALRTIKQLTTSACKIVITVPAGPIAFVDRAFGHRRHYTKKDLRELLEGEGLVIERLESSGFPFFNLYRIGLVIYGKNTLGSIEKISASKPSAVLMALMKIFSWLFQFNKKSGNLGWQLIAVCRNP